MDHFVTGKANLGRGTNNQGKLKALFFLLNCTVDRQVTHFQVYSDSALDIGWMNKRLTISNPGLIQLARQLKEIALSFRWIRFNHVFMEANERVDAL